MKETKLWITCLLIIAMYFSFAQNKEFDSKLPIVFINTSGNEIVDEPKISAELGIVWNDNGEMNSTHNEHNHFNGKIGIEIRGSSSQMFPKKSFGFELWDDQNEGVNFSLLGLPEEEDWILYAPYTDKSLIRNVLTFTLAAKLEGYAPRCRFVELFINNEYWGVYVLMEKIKRDKNRVDINKLKEDEISGEDVTGGYIVKIDKTTGSGGDGWHSDYDNANGSRSFYQYEYPKQEDITEEQKNYIQSYIHEFETAIYDQNFEGAAAYGNYINHQSFYNYIVMNEFSKNVDGYRLSTFLFKDKNGKLNAGPLWDFNLAYGNANYYKGWETAGLQMYADLGSDSWQNPFWWKGMLQDLQFKNSLRCSWDNLRESTFADETILETIDSLVSVLQYPAVRNFNRWAVIGEYVWPNYYVGSSYLAEVDWLKSWVLDRMRWMDFAMPGECSQISNVVSNTLENSVKIFPNPVLDNLYFQISLPTVSNLNVCIFTTNGRLVLQKEFPVFEGDTPMRINLQHLNKGIFIARVYDGQKEVSTHKIVKY